MNRTVIGIDVGGTTTKIVGFRQKEKGEQELIAPQFVRATDPKTSIYGAFGKFTVDPWRHRSHYDDGCRLGLCKGCNLQFALHLCSGVYQQRRWRLVSFGS